MGIKKGEEHYLELFNKVHNNKYTYPDFTYKTNEDKIKIICPIHGEFEQIISNHSSGKGCQKCARELVGLKRRSNIYEILECFKKVHGDLYSYEKFTEYSGVHNKIDIFCKKHNEYFNQNISSHKRGTGCPKCGKEKSDSHKQDSLKSFLNKAEKFKTDNLSFDKVSYESSKTKVTMVCKIHGDFEIIPNNFLMGKSCPKCKVNISKAEQEIADILKAHFPDLEQSNKKVLEGKELDIYIPSKKVAIEYNGLYWHSELHKDKNYHLDKLNSCKDKGVKLIQIFEDEWLNKKEIVLSRLFNILGITEKTIYARKCEVRQVDSKTVTKFLEENHIQGKLGAKARLGLYYENELVSLMTFGELRKNLGLASKEGSYELLRFCNKINTTVIGGASKLLKYFEKVYLPNEIISYADLRWSEGNLYEKLNFKFVHQSEPNYFYTKGLERENRFKYRKSELVKQGFDENKTEKEIMNELGFSRIYDTGTLKFVK